VEKDHRHVEALTARMAELGAPDPAGWARSEITEDIAQQARYLVLRRLWTDAIDRWAQPDALERVDASARLIAQGATVESVAAAMRLAAYEAVFATLSIIDDGHDPDAPADAPGWLLVETDAEEQLSGRRVGGLHESLLSLDPSGREGADFMT
jgi:hypothetical protein